VQKISVVEVSARIRRDNPWWSDADYKIVEAAHPKRVYFQPFWEIATNRKVKRATILMGPRRVGKTFMLKQFIHEAISTGTPAQHILYVSIDTPIYSGMHLERFLEFLPNKDRDQGLVVFDEIQYLKDWEIHLKDLVDNYPNIKFVASGSATAALKLASQESGAGRFSEFMLPPLTFYEFLSFLGEDELHVEAKPAEEGKSRYNYAAKDIEALNARFIDYLNYGGYPEAVLNSTIRDNREQFIKNDIIDKVLLKDLPSLYGIQNIQDLNVLFSYLAYNAGNEANYQIISEQSGINKATVRKFIEYLESAFLIIKVSSVDDRCKVGARERNFKIYLSNPSMRAALFTPAQPEDHTLIGMLAECAIYSQWQHAPNFSKLKYARWRNEGEVDIVYLQSSGDPLWIGEVKWSDRVSKQWAKETGGLAALIRKHDSIESAFMTSKTIQSSTELEGITLNILPSALYCYTVGRNITRSLDFRDVNAPSKRVKKTKD
jgi:predicted AAA+ superfamily ATPase